jgi:hypothetical protein
MCVNNKFQIYVIKKNQNRFSVSKPDACLILTNINFNTYMMWRRKFYKSNLRKISRIMNSNHSHKIRMECHAQYNIEFGQYLQEDAKIKNLIGVELSNHVR